MASAEDEAAVEALKRLQAMGLDMDEAESVLQEMIGEGYVAGGFVAANMVEDAGGDVVRPSYLGLVDWSRWEPGNNAAAALLAAEDDARGLAQLLDDAGVTIKGVGDTLLDLLGNSLGEGIANGEGIDDLSARVGEVLDDPDRGDIIARTESARASSVASMDSFAENGIGGKEWMTFDPCPICEENEADGVIDITDVFSSGDTEPPAHPNCECAIAPVVDTSD